jgi:hypothetical protein
MTLELTAALLVCVLTVQVRAASPRGVSGPYTHENLSIYLIHGRNLSSRPYLTLEEALAQHKMVVYETSNVNELSVENLSDQEVYIQSGEIVKGGQQDRTLTDDLIVPPHSGRMPISAFCVEHGRWSRRGTESTARFEAAPAAVASKELKQAIRAKSSQSEVWDRVKQVQASLSSALNASVAAPASPSSLQLSLENEKVQKSADAYVHDLSGILNGKPDVIGYAFAVNGKMNSADVYASSDLFRKLWPKLLKASAIEALGEARGGTKFTPPNVDAVRATLDEASAAQANVRDITARVRLVTRETPKTAVYDTQDRAAPNATIHTAYILK